MKVCYFGTYERDYSRNIINISGLRQNHIEVIECHIDKPKFNNSGTHLNTAIFFIKLPFSIIYRSLHLLIKGYKIFFKNRPDLYIIGFPGHLDVMLGWIMSRTTGRPLCFDTLISLYDTLVTDRKYLSEKNPLAYILWLTEYIIYKFPDIILIDTEIHKNFLVNKFRINKEKIHALPIGADDNLYKL